MSWIGDRARHLDEVTGADRAARVGSVVGGYWNFLGGLVCIVAGLVAALFGFDGWWGVCLIGVAAVAIGLFIGPPQMVRRMTRRSD